MANVPFRTQFSLPPIDPAQLPATMHETLCPSDQPLVLFPIRIETRFFAQPDGSSELRVRLFPDKIHVNSHETELTQSEHHWGLHYWEQDWRAGNDLAARRIAWGQLADRFGSGRAAWIVRMLRPSNSRDRPTTPVAPGDALPVAPRFPEIVLAPENDESTWRRAPRADLLPDRWIAVVSSGGSPMLTATGRDIVRPLPIGPDPKVTPAEIPGEELAVDEGMRWMIDFDVAEVKGMAMRILISAATLDLGIDSLFVFGVAASTNPKDTSARLADLFDAHHYTDGLEFLRQGTPSNNSAERRAGYDSQDTGHQRSFDAEVARHPPVLGPASNAARLGVALGLTTEQRVESLGHVTGATAEQELDARSMNIALWQTGFGYYLSNMIGMDGTGLTVDDITWAREHFVSRVRAPGPFAILRCGRQPYGVVPVTSLDLWKPRPGNADPAGRDQSLRDLLGKLRDNIWRPHLGDVARVGQRTEPPDPDADLADVMRREGVSTGYRVRSMLGRHYLQHLRAFLGEDLEFAGFFRAADALTSEILEQLGFTARPRIARGIYAELGWRMNVPLVQAGEVSPLRMLEPDYIGELLREPHIADLVAARPNPASPDGASLLHVLLRHAMLREYASAAAFITAGATGMDLQRALRDEEIVDLMPDAQPKTSWLRQLDMVVPAVTGTKTVRSFLEALTTFEAPPVRELGEFRRSLEHLRRLDSDKLQVLMQGTLDLSGHRLDAWVTSLATSRLAELRDAQPRGLRVGGYGWVENLISAPATGAAVPGPPGDSEPVVIPAADSGFIHAPSLTHAATAALLRNAHLGHRNVAEEDGPFAINLSSRRVRDAVWLLDGMRQDQPLGALLGYRLERRLHEKQMDRFIHPLRELAPLTAKRLETTDLPVDSIAANNVVDGEVLVRQWRENPTQLKTRLQAEMIRVNSTHAATDVELVVLGDELDAVGDAIDAVSDALTAEAAYQMVRGNSSRMASTLKAIADGDAPPPELEVTRMPRSGLPLTHRVVTLFGAKASSTPGWARPDSSARATAEPVLNAWAATLLGDARRVRCTVEQVDATGENVLKVREFALSNLKIAPLDVVFGVDDSNNGDTVAHARVELEDRVLEQARRGAEGFGHDASLRVQHARPGDLAVGEITLLDAIEQARSIRALIGGARAAEPSDVQPPDRAATGKIDLVELEARVMKAEDALIEAHQALATMLQDGVGVNAERLRKSLQVANQFGVGRRAATPAGSDPATIAVLQREARCWMLECRARVDSISASRVAALSDDPRRRRDQLTERMRAVFGPAFLVLPRFSCDETVASELTNALSASEALQGGDPLAVYAWFIRAERVRVGLARLSAPLRGAEILGTGERLALRIAQLPFDADDRWVGLPLEAGRAAAPGKLSLVVQGAKTVDTARPMVGLWFDEWVEVIPNFEETTAIAFQFDPPDACAPQSILLAVPPDAGEAWTIASVHRVLLETLDLAKLRAVELESLSEAAHYLPALFFAFNASDEAVATDFSPLTTERFS